jgi:hypothetical protein
VDNVDPVRQKNDLSSALDFGSNAASNQIKHWHDAGLIDILIVACGRLRAGGELFSALNAFSSLAGCSGGTADRDQWLPRL